MTHLVVDNTSVEVDPKGFMRHPELWNENVAVALAQLSGVDVMTEGHWTIVRFLRSYYDEYEKAPRIRRLCRETGLNLRQIYLLFPEGPARGACKVAGLPRADGCV